MVKAAHTVMSCCSMTFGQHQIVSAVAKQNQQYQRFKFLPRNPVESGFSCMRTCSMSVISSSYFLLSAITDRFNARNQFNMSLSENRLSTRVEVQARVALRSARVENVSSS